MTEKPIRLREIRRQEEQNQKVKSLMDMFKLNPISSNNSYKHYQPIGSSSTATADLETHKIQMTRQLMQMFGLSERIEY